MGTYSHEQLQRARMETVKPPAPSRRCQGQKWWPEVVDWRTGDVTREAQWVPCSSGALAFIPEVAYCGHHMPPLLQEIANERLVLWQALAIDLWQEVCHDIPVPPQILPPADDDTDE